MYTIEVSSQQAHIAIEESSLCDVVRKTLADDGVNSATISIAIVDDPTIAVLNEQYLGHEGPTDVLSFLLECDSTPDESESNDSPQKTNASVNADKRHGFGKRIEGEIIISAETARQSAAEYDWKPEAELVLYLVHGLLHLCGYDDLEESDRKEMRQREVEAFSHLGLVPHYNESETL
jgi:probable rRNA maturation factor